MHTVKLPVRIRSMGGMHEEAMIVSTMSMLLAHPGFIVLVCMGNQNFLPNLEGAQLTWHMDGLPSCLQKMVLLR